MQIFLIHTPWFISKRGSLIGYDFADTKAIFVGKTAKAITIWGLGVWGMNNLCLKVSRLLTSGDVVFTLHDLPNDEPNIITMLFYTIKEVIFGGPCKW